MVNDSIALKTELYVALTESATFLGHAESNTPEWHAFREGRIGGSEVGAIAGESKYESAYSLWAKKLGLIPDNREDNEPMYWGRSLEPNIITRFEQDHPELTIYRDVGTWVNKKHDWMLANPDALYQKPNGDLGVIEIKTARFADDWVTGVPRYYATQVQWYLQTLGLQEAYVAVLISGSDYREYYIEADRIWQDYDLQRVIEFRECVNNQTRPAWDGSEATITTLRTQHPDIDPDEAIELGDLGMHYDILLNEISNKEVEAKTMMAEILHHMGKARVGLVHDLPIFIRTARNGGKPYLTRKKGQK